MYFHIYLYADFILPLAASDICPLTPETKVLTFLLTYNHSAAFCTESNSDNKSPFKEYCWILFGGFTFSDICRYFGIL